MHARSAGIIHNVIDINTYHVCYIIADMHAYEYIILDSISAINISLYTCLITLHSNNFRCILDFTISLIFRLGFICLIIK